MIEYHFQLFRYGLFCHTVFALLQGLAHTEDRCQAKPDCRIELGGGDLVAFMEQCTALTVADDDVAASKIDQHARRHRPGEGALLVLAQVLRAPGDIAALQHGLCLRQIRVRYTHAVVGTAQILHARQHTLQQRLVARQIAVHFPVSNH